jgi:hypothetical protein
MALSMRDHFNLNAGRKMKTVLTFFALLLVLKSTAFAKIVMMDDKVYLRKDGRQVPVFIVNELIEKEKVKKVHLYGEGKVHLISFAKKGEKEKLYSVDDQGYIYAIEPFAKYKVDKIVDNGHFVFHEVPGKKFRVTDKGYFVH